MEVSLEMYVHTMTISDEVVGTCNLRQAVGGTITVWNNVTNEVWMFMKEISSDGDVSTVS